MKLRYLGFIVVLILAVQTIVAQENTEIAQDNLSLTKETVDIVSLIKEIAFNSQQDAFSNYSYEMQYTKRKKSLWGTGKLVRRYNVILPSRIPKDRVYQHRLLKVYDSNNRLTQSDIVSDRNQIFEELDKVENEVDTENTEKSPKVKTGGYLTLLADASSGKTRLFLINLVEILEGAEFTNYKELVVNGRDTISLDFQPIPNKKFADDLFYLERMEGVMLIDKEDKRIVEVEAFPIGKLSKYRNIEDEEKKDVRVFHYLQTRVPEGFWFPQFVTLNFMAFEKDYKDLRVKMDFAFTNYERFTVNVGDYTRNSVLNQNETKPPERENTKPPETRKDLEPKSPISRPNHREDNNN